ncbi:threonine/serine exporter [Paenibacillus chitinolyticus]|uniref:Threonine/serine exporter n=1 Tax=Paenibacillus chitinolyticus TaxID=79263 RepID=A0A410WPE5_9BACL|nr:threonine/serine exporter family protein [Paenibacillus chitinolyticus]MCY9590840.1 threonine/serine exporter family protein [Paenibacillus chitinolyticus]MCY9598747.1 threonine/serine exporter family protein [Paenibacillus chitinolyticus]QAV16286.1 threonine/serine exporter [Paenibacillus chitinolyticus]
MIAQLVTSYIASAAFGIIFNVPRNTLIQCGFVGMMGWLVYVALVRSDTNAIVATLAAAFFVTVISRVFARLYKTPIIVFSVAGIIPLVPGGMAYDAMRSFVENDYNLAVQLAAKAFMISGSIAAGLIFSEVMNQLFKRPKV